MNAFRWVACLPLITTACLVPVDDESSPTPLGETPEAEPAAAQLAGGLVTVAPTRSLGRSAVEPGSDGLTAPPGTVLAESPRKFGAIALGTDGQLRGSFDDDGIAGTSFSGYDSAQAYAVDDVGGSLIMGGVVADGSNLSWAFTKHTSSGALDTAFSGDGRRVLTWANSTRAWVSEIKVYDGHIYAIGHVYVDGARRMGVAKLSATTGALEDSAYVTFPGWEHVWGVSLAISGSELIVAGAVGHADFTTERIALAKLDRNDFDLIPSFGTGGRLVVNIATEESAAAVRIDTTPSPYKIVVGGSATYGAEGEKFWVARYASDGTPDASFGGGIVVTNFAGPHEGINDIAVSFGKVIAVGYSNPSDTRWAIARYNSNGTLDTSCDGNGLQEISFNGGYASAFGVSIGSRIRIGGWSLEPDGSGYDFAAASLMNDCSLDSGFDDNGLRVVDHSAYDGGYGITLSGSNIFLGGVF